MILDAANPLSNKATRRYDMTTNTNRQEIKDMTNGVDVDKVMNVIGAIENDTSYAKFQFRAKNEWVHGGLTRSRIKEFFAGNAEDTTRKEAFVVDSDEPLMLAGEDSAPNAVEVVLHALASCLTTSLIYHAAVRGIEIGAVESSYTGDIDVRGLLGLSDEVRKGYNKVTVNMRVKSEESVETLTELAMYSPVFDIVSKSLPVEFKLEAY
jgi:uncharacterized OsmC-like protein